MAYNHPWPPDENNKYQLNNLHQAMDYNAQGQPIVRTLATAQSSTTDASIDGFDRQQPFTLYGVNVSALLGWGELV